jgi:predicted TIM-barrel fold metal-dependent hydrolase
VIIDVNANLSRWPFRRTPCDELPRLIERFLKYGVQQAWMGSLDGLLHRDIGGVNLRLAEACRQERRVKLLPFGSVNPMLPDWQEDLRRCAEDYHMPGIRLHPNYHGYRLDEPAAAELLDLAAKRGLIVQLAIRMEDTRLQHPLMPVGDVDAKPLLELIKARPSLRLVVLNGLMSIRGEELRSLAATDRVWFEIAMSEGIGAVEHLLRSVPLGRVLFGSHLPFFALESPVLKLQEAGLDDRQRQAIEHLNAERLLGGPARLQATISRRGQSGGGGGSAP